MHAGVILSALVSLTVLSAAPAGANGQQLAMSDAEMSRELSSLERTLSDTRSRLSDLERSLSDLRSWRSDVGSQLSSLKNSSGQMARDGASENDLRALGNDLNGKISDLRDKIVRLERALADGRQATTSATSAASGASEEAVKRLAADTASKLNDLNSKLADLRTALDRQDIGLKGGYRGSAYWPEFAGRGESQSLSASCSGQGEVLTAVTFTMREHNGTRMPTGMQWTCARPATR